MSKNNRVVWMLPTWKCFDVTFWTSVLFWCDIFISETGVKHTRTTSMPWWWCLNTVVVSTFQNKMKIIREIFISSSQRDTDSQGCFKNKWMPNNVFDVLYLNLYAYLHYSYFPGLGTNPIEMEMRCSVSWQSWGEREREFPGSLLLKMCWKQIFRILWLHGIGYRGLHKPLKARQWAALFNQQKSPPCWTHSPHSRG